VSATPWITPVWIDAILVLVLLELAASAAWLARRGALVLIAPLSLYLASGAALLLALRAALAGAASAWIAAALLASGVVHVLALVRLRSIVPLVARQRPHPGSGAERDPKMPGPKAAPSRRTL